VNAHHRWRRGDGTVLSGVDLNQAVPMLLGELDDIVRLIDLIEEWLRMDDLARDQLSQWRLAIADVCTGPDPAWPVIDELGTVSVTLHRIVRAGIPDTGHLHAPAN